MPSFFQRLEGLPIILVFVVLLAVFMFTAPQVFLAPNIYTTFLSTLPPLILLAGDGAPRLSAALGDRPVRISGGPGLPHAAWVAKLAADRAAAAGAGLTPPPEPLYLRPPDVTTPRARTQVWKKSSPACRPTSN